MKRKERKKIEIENYDSQILDEELVFDDGNKSDLVKKIERLKKDLKKSLLEKQEYLNGWQRERATFSNFKKNLAQERKEAVQFGNEQIISDILLVLDSFNMAFSNKEIWGKIDKTWSTGIEYIYNQLKDILKLYGLTEYTDLGKQFDPARHHSQEVVSVNIKKDDGKIIEVIQKGYIVKDSILRPALVKVGKYNKNN